MKKRIALVLGLGLLLAAGAWLFLRADTLVGAPLDTVKERYAQVQYYVGLRVYQTESGYAVIRTSYNYAVEKDYVDKTAFFTSERSNYDVHGGWKLIPSGNLEQFLDRTVESIEAEFGPIHADVATGEYCPAYVTEDGYLVILDVFAHDGTVSSVYEMDLLSPDYTRTNLVISKRMEDAWEEQS